MVKEVSGAGSTKVTIVEINNGASLYTMIGC